MSSLTTSWTNHCSLIPDPKQKKNSQKQRGEGGSGSQEKDPGTPPDLPITEDKEIPRKETSKEETSNKPTKRQFFP
ncbi:hypothetical protein Tco_1322418 [Tanacetum coccineum]